MPLGFRPLSAAGLLLLPAAAVAGPPFLTDDPEPTDVGHYEIYAFTSLDKTGGDRSGSAGLDLNFGGLKNVQLTATLPVDFARDSGRPGWRSGAGDVKLGAKYRFLKQSEAVAVSAAIFPRVILPTAQKAFGTGRVQFLLPLWIQHDEGQWSFFGGGGYSINLGTGNRNSWQEGLVVSRELRSGFSLGAEIEHEGADASDGEATTSLGLGSIIHLRGPYSLLLSGGPSFSRGGDGYHAYLALGLNL